MNHEFLVLRGTIKVAGRDFPMYSGFVTPEFVLEYAKVPNFDNETDTNYTIANQIPKTDQDNSPSQWQRPKIQVKIDQIRSLATKNNDLADGFDPVDQAEIIPNAILLAVDPSTVAMDGHDVRIEDVGDAPDSLKTMIWEKADFPDGVKPLWIVDGQHRTLGLSAADSVKKQEHPVIILYDEAGEAYPHAMVAKIFGQVTTHATQLEPAHKEWLEYCFSQGKYSGEGATARKNAMRTLLRMCTVDTPKTGVTNIGRFKGEIPFHPKKSYGGFRGFTYRLVDGEFGEHVEIESKKRKLNWIDLLVEHLWTQPNLNAEIHKPTDCADAILAAIAALWDLDTAHNAGSHFFSSEDPKPPLCDMWLIELLKRLVSRPEMVGWSKAKWTKFLTQRHFATDWSVFGDIGTANTTSMGLISQRVFNYLFMADDPPQGTNYVSIDHMNHATTTLPQWMAGSQIKIRVRMRPSNSTTGKDKTINVFSTTGQQVQPANNLVDADNVVDIFAKSMNVVLKNIFDGAGTVALPTKSCFGHSKKARFTRTPRVTNEDYFRLEYESYHRTGNNRIRK